MSSKQALIGIVAAAALSTASASDTNLVQEKQNKAAVLTELLQGISVVMVSPECTIKNVIHSSNIHTSTNNL